MIATVERTEATARFEDAYPTSFAVAYRAAYRVTGVRGDAEDIAQEAMVRAYAQWTRVSGYVEAWVTRVATNLALDGVRRRRRGARFRPGIAEPSLVHERLDLARAVAGLPKRQREAVALRYIADLGEAEVARVMGCTVGAVKQHASRGLASLRANGHLEMEEP